MRKNKYFLNTALAAVLGIALLGAVLVRAFAPAVILPRLDVPNLVLISLLALLADQYGAGGTRHFDLWIPVLSGVSFGLLPFAACLAAPAEAVKLGLVGGGIFTVTAWLYAGIQDRLRTGSGSRAAPVLGALGLYFACQCFAGML